MSELSLCRWGILSTAAIARKNWRAIAQTKTGTVVAVASRRHEAAKTFVRECQAHTAQYTAPEPVEGYEALLERKDIDAVYIPLPTGLRKEWIIAAAESGKHVLAEKPTALSTTDLVEILAVCKRNSVMFMHSARLPLLRACLDDGQSIGEIRRIACHFSFLGDENFSKSNIRVDSLLEPFGCLGDLGWYCIRFLLWANRWQTPTHATGRCLTGTSGGGSESKIPTEFSAELIFPGGSSGSFYCSFLTGNQQWAHISGTNGNAYLKDFVLPHYGSEVSFDVENPAFVVNGCDFHMQEHTRRTIANEYASGHSPAQEINMFETFNKIVLGGKLDPFWGDIALATQRVMDQLLKSAMTGNSN
jgi:predicted dehydrogenase